MAGVLCNSLEVSNVARPGARDPRPRTRSARRGSARPGCGDSAARAGPRRGLRTPRRPRSGAPGRRPRGRARGGRHEVRTRLPAGLPPAAHTYLRGREAPAHPEGSERCHGVAPAVARASSRPRLLLRGVGGERGESPGVCNFFFTFFSTAPRKGKKNVDRNKEVEEVKLRVRAGKAESGKDKWLKMG